MEFKRSEFVQGGLGESQAGAGIFKNHHLNSNVMWVCIYFSISSKAYLIILYDFHMLATGAVRFKYCSLIDSLPTAEI